MKTLLSTENQTSLSIINTNYFNDSLDFSKYGTVADITKFIDKGLFYITLTVKNADNSTFLLFDNLTLKKINIREGVNYIYNEIKSNSWGFILIPNDVNANVISTVNIDKINSIIYPLFPVNAWTIGDVNIDIINGSCTLSTNKGRSISIVGEELFNDKNYLKALGVEASAIVVDNLPTGFYKFDIKRGIYDKNNNDSLYLYNGKTLTKIADITELTTSNKTVEIEVIYEFIYLIAVDLNKSSGATEFTINNVQRLRDLSYFPPQKMSLIPNSKLGRVTVDKSGITISTGTNSKGISTIISSLNLENIPVQIKENGQRTKVKGNNLPSSIIPRPSSFNVIVVDDLTKTTFTEGSYAVWDVPNGEYLIQWLFKTGETVESIKADSIYFYNGQQLQLLGNIQLERSPNNEELIEVRNGKLGIIVLDEKDKSGTTQIKITNIEQTKSEAELPPLNDDESTNNSDGNNNENGENLEMIINPVNQEINFTFGGDITAYRSILNLDENKELTLTLDKPLIIEISQNNSVIYSQQYINELTVTLLAGEYQLNLFTESSIEEDYQLILNTVSFDE